MNSDLFKIEALTVKDAPFLTVLQKESPGRPWSLGETKQLLEDSTIQGWGIRKKTELFGFILIQKTLESVDILDFVVEKSVRRQGAGQRLYDCFECMCKKDQIKEIFLEVAASNHPALSFYHKQGFINIRIRPLYYTSPSGKEDSFLMKKTIIVG